MTEVTTKGGDRAAELTLPTGCITCDGPLTVRISQAGAFGYCPSCHLLSHPEVEVDRSGMKIGQPVRMLA